MVSSEREKIGKRYLKTAVRAQSLESFWKQVFENLGSHFEISSKHVII